MDKEIEEKVSKLENIIRKLEEDNKKLMENLTIHLFPQSENGQYDRLSLIEKNIQATNLTLNTLMNQQNETQNLLNDLGVVAQFRYKLQQSGVRFDE
jgi:hypothetical protein